MGMRCLDSLRTWPSMDTCNPPSLGLTRDQSKWWYLAILRSHTVLSSEYTIQELQQCLIKNWITTLLNFVFHFTVQSQQKNDFFTPVGFQAKHPPVLTKKKKKIQHRQDSMWSKPWVHTYMSATNYFVFFSRLEDRNSASSRIKLHQM